MAVNGADVVGPDSRVGLVFQEPRLLPWRTVMDNVTLPLALAGWNDKRRLERGTQLIASSASRGSNTRIPGNCPAASRSAPGSRERSALEPDVLLLDEPFSVGRRR